MKHFFILLILFLPAVLRAQDTLDLEEQLLQEEVIEEPVYTDDEEDTEYYEDDGGYEPADDEEEAEEHHTLLKPSELPSTQEYRSEDIHQQGFNESKWRDIVKNRDYSETPGEEEEAEQSKEINPSLPFGGEILKAIAYTVIIGIVIFVLYLVFRNVNFTPRVRNITTPYLRGDEEDIREMDLPALLKQALSEKNYKLAVRYYFLSILKELHDAGKIHWEKDKTNRDYLFELFAKDYYYEEMRTLTRGYEEVWYGERSFADEALLRMITGFESIQSKINSLKTS